MGVSKRPYGAILLVVGCALYADPSEARGQESPGADSVRVSGWVMDVATELGIPGVRVSLSLRATPDAEARVVWADVTDSTGAFESTPIKSGDYRLSVEALGYKTADEDVEPTGARVMDVRVELVPEPLELEPLVVVTKRQSRLEVSGFYERRRMGQGYSLTRDEIEAYRPMRASDVFRYVPGVSLAPSRRGPIVRFRSCTPDVILDGTPLVGPVSLDEILTAEDVEAIEVFSTATAPIGLRTTSCGAVMIWTREGRHDEKGHPLTWKRGLFAAAFIVFAYLMTH